MTQFPPRTHRARDILAAVGRSYPHAWQQVDHFRAARGRDLPAWPEWCYCPLHGTYAIVSGSDEAVPFARSHHTGILGALAAWRVTQGIYRFDPALYECLIATPIAGDLPCDPLYRLPDWCVYLETPGMAWPDGRTMHGAWAHLDWSDGAADELRLVIDCALDVADPLDPVSGLVPVPIILGACGLAAALERVIASGAHQARQHGYTPEFDARDAPMMATVLAPLVSLVLYLCADDAELGDGSRRPQNPRPKRTRRDGWRLFPAQSPTTWEVGVRLGAALRRAYHEAMWSSRMR